MHERSLVKALLRQVQGVATKHAHSRVLSIRVRIGAFSGVEPELLASAYNDIVADTPLRGTALDLVYVPLAGTCDHCGNLSRIERFKFKCDQCGGQAITLRGGEEMLLDSVVMQETEP
jgi:hydrogenase nickel incorporation protein HypA/HybF